MADETSTKPLPPVPVIRLYSSPKLSIFNGQLVAIRLICAGPELGRGAA